MTDISKRREDGEMEVDEKDDDDTCMDVENGSKGGEKIRGENNCFAYLRNESSAVDFFFNVVPSSTKEEVHKYLEESWSESALVTLRIIFNLGNVRNGGGGKQDRKNFYRSILWLWEKEPMAVILNVRNIPEHASHKCLFNLLMYIVHEDQDTPYSLQNQLQGVEDHAKRRRKSGRKQDLTFSKMPLKEERMMKFAKQEGFDSFKELRTERGDDEIEKMVKKRKTDVRCLTKWKTPEISQKYRSFCQELDSIAKKDELLNLKAEKKKIAGIIKERRKNPQIQALYEAVVHCISDGLVKEHDDLRKKKSVGGLYGKWAPNQRGMHNKATWIAADLINHVLPRLGMSLDNSGQKYQKLLSEIREASQVPEHFTGSKRFGEVNYDRMASRCRLLWGRKVFQKHDQKRYDKYLEKSAVTALTDKKSKDGVKTGALLPHELVDKVSQLTKRSENYKQATLEINLQWWGLIKSTREAIEAGEGIGNCLPMCDVSGSMAGTPMSVAIALSMLLAESLPRDSPLHGKIMTFHSRPSLCTLKNVPDYDMVIDKSNLEDLDGILKSLGDFGARVSDVRGYDWGGSTNIEAAFDLLLQIARTFKLSSSYVENMCLVIFSDMEFDEAIGRGTEATMYEHIQQKFEKFGYQIIPRTVFWNLRASVSQPVQSAKHDRVALLSGFSSGLLKSFLKGDWTDFTPIGQMIVALRGPLYDKLVLPDMAIQ